MSFKPRIFLFLHAGFEPKYACAGVSARRCNLMHSVGLINCTEQFEYFQPTSGIVSQVTGCRVQGWFGGFCGNLCFDLLVTKLASSVPMQPSLTLTKEGKWIFIVSPCMFLQQFIFHQHMHCMLKHYTSTLKQSIKSVIKTSFKIEPLSEMLAAL